MNCFFDDEGCDGEVINQESIDQRVLNHKKSLVDPSGEEYEILLKALKDRLDESQAETIYVLGIGEGESPGLSKEDMDASILNLRKMAEDLGCEYLLLRERKEEEGLVVDALIRARVQEKDFMEIRVAVVGNVDAGKSTLLGVLTHIGLDNGRGQARQKLFRHKHEMESGRTSSVSNDILGFDCLGNVVNKPEHGSLDWVRICEKSAKVITFIDLAGHEKYLKTTVFGMTGHAPDFGMLMVGANAGIVGMTKEHLGLALALGVPVLVVVTKIDMCPANILQETLQMIHKVLKSPGCRKIPVLVQNHDDVVVSATNFTSERMCPIFQVSNVTGENLHLLKSFLNLLTTRMPTHLSEPAEFQIDETFAVPGVGTVASGTTLRGQIKLGETLLLGPDAIGNFNPIVVKSIHRKRMAVNEVKGGQTASFSLKKYKRSQIRKGMVLVSPSVNPQACWEFDGEILVLHHPTTISVKYQAMVHVGSVRQTATILTMSSEHLRTGDKAQVKFRFIKNPEYIRINAKLVFREGRTKAVGTVTKLYPYVSAVAQNLKSSRPVKKTQQQRQHQQQQNQQHNQQQPPNQQSKSSNGHVVEISENTTTTTTSAAGGDVTTTTTTTAGNTEAAATINAADTTTTTAADTTTTTDATTSAAALKRAKERNRRRNNRNRQKAKTTTSTTATTTATTATATQPPKTNSS